MQNPLTDENVQEKIRAHMDSRRAIVSQQIAADNDKSALCNEINEFKSKILGLKERINALKITDPELFKYIQQIEFINAGIWCEKCNAAKTIHHRTTDDASLHDELLSSLRSENNAANDDFDQMLLDKCAGADELFDLSNEDDDQLMFDKHRFTSDESDVEPLSKNSNNAEKPSFIKIPNHRCKKLDTLIDQKLNSPTIMPPTIIDTSSMEPIERMATDKYAGFQISSEIVDIYAAKFDECFRRIAALEEKVGASPTNSLADLIADHSNEPLVNTDDYDFTETVDNQYKITADDLI